MTMLRKIALALSTLVGLTLTADAQTLRLPQIGIQDTGTCRQLSVKNPINAAQTAMGCFETGGFRSQPNILALPSSDQGSSGAIDGFSVGGVKLPNALAGKASLGAPNVFSGPQALLGINAYTASPIILSADTSDPNVVKNGTWSAPSWAFRYHSGADFGNTTPVSAQRLIRCTTASDYRVYESCDNIDFYSRGGYVPFWSTNKTVAIGDKLVAHDNVYRATKAGTTAAAGTGPSNTAPSEPDNTVIWAYEGSYFLSAKAGWSMTGKAYGDAGKTWALNPNMIFNQGFRSEGYGMELDVGNYSGLDWQPGVTFPGIQGIWLGGVTQNTSQVALNIGSQLSTQGKPVWYYGVWCNNALSAGQTCYEDWSNSVAGFHTASFASKNYDLWMQSSSFTGAYFNGTYRDAAISTTNATLGAGAHAMVLASGQDICFSGGNSCWRWDAATQKMFYRRDGADLMSIDGSGAIRAKGTITGGVTP